MKPPSKTLVTVVGLAAAGGLAVAFGAPPAPVLEWGLVLAAAVVLRRLVSWLDERLAVATQDPYEETVGDRAFAGDRRTEVEVLTERVEASIGSAAFLRLPLTPVLREIATGKLARHDLDLHDDPAKIRAVLGDEVTTVIGVGDTPRPTGTDLDTLERVVTELEET